MAERKTKKDLIEQDKEKIADEMTVKKAKTASKKVATETDKLKAEQDIVKSKQEVVDKLAPEADDTADSGTAIVAKAGKRSAKGLKEAEEKQAKAERQKNADEVEEADKKPKQPVKPTRSKLERRGKKYREATKLIEKDKAYAIKPALELLPKISTASFDATAELHLRLNVDPKQADQNIRDTIVLPAGTGKTARVAVFGESDDVATAKKAGADIAGSDDFLIQLDKGTINFDVLIANPKVMAKLGKYARLLGPKGLMPNPKSGTVTTDIEKAVKEAKAGRVEYRVDETGIVHIAFGKVSFGTDKLLQNLETALRSVKGNKPGSIKGSFVQSAYLSVSMGPSVKIDLAEITSL